MIKAKRSWRKTQPKVRIVSLSILVHLITRESVVIHQHLHTTLYNRTLTTPLRNLLRVFQKKLLMEMDLQVNTIKSNRKKKKKKNNKMKNLLLKTLQNRLIPKLTMVCLGNCRMLILRINSGSSTTEIRGNNKNSLRSK